MTLRLRTLLMVGLTLIGLILAVQLVSCTVLRQSVERAEVQETRQVVRGVQNVIGLTVSQFNTRFADWSDWDDAYAFVKDLNPAFVKSNLVDPSLVNLRVNVILFVRPSGEIAWGTGWDMQNRRRVPVPAVLRERLSRRDRTLMSPVGSSVAGILVLPEGPMILSARPILTTASTGPSRGTLITGRYLNASEIGRLAEANRVLLEIERVDDPRLPRDFQEARASLAGNVWVRPFDEDTVRGYSLLRDIDGKPALLLRVETSRGLARQGEESSQELMIALILIGLVFAAITLVFLERNVLSRLTRFSLEVGQIAAGGDLASRTSIRGEDELGRLSHSVNGMLAALERFEREREEASSRLRKTTAAAEAASRAKSGFLANMSHELRTPMNAIIGFSELLEDERFGPLAEKQRKYVANILSSGRHLLQLINDILDLSKVEAGRMELACQPVDAGEAVGDVVTVVRSLAVKKEIEIRTHLEPGLPTVHADPAKFKQVVYNLLSNAIKFTPQGGKIDISASQAGEQTPVGNEGPISGPAVILSVSDTGIGIAPENQHRVFLEFEQVDSSYCRLQQGTGLGLALTRKLVELHGGRIWLESAGVGKGATFHVLLPVEPGAAPSAGLEALPELPGGSAPEAATSEPPRPLVLVVEDERPSSELLHQYLDQAGYDVAHAYDGEQAVRMAAELQPVVITLDLVLPKRDGWGVLAELKSLPDTRQIPVVIVSITEDPGNSYALGAAEFLVKPVGAERLVAAVRRASSEGAHGVTTVLVVDDEPKSVELLTTALRANGYSVLSAQDGQNGVDLALSRRPDAIVLDLVMPGMSGFDVVDRLRSLPEVRDTPILICTAQDLTAQERRRLNSQVERIASKANNTNLVRELRALASGRKKD